MPYSWKNDSLTGFQKNMKMFDHLRICILCLYVSVPAGVFCEEMSLSGIYVNVPAGAFFVEKNTLLVSYNLCFTCERARRGFFAGEICVCVWDVPQVFLLKNCVMGMKIEKMILKQLNLFCKYGCRSLQNRIGSETFRTSFQVLPAVISLTHIALTRKDMLFLNGPIARVLDAVIWPRLFCIRSPRTNTGLLIRFVRSGNSRRTLSDSRTYLDQSSMVTPRYKV